MLPKVLIVFLTAIVVSSLPATSQRWLRVSYDAHRADLWAVASTPAGTFVAVGDNGTIQRAVGTDTMLPVRGNRFDDHLRDVVYSPLHGLVAVGDGAFVLTSTDDGISWSSRTTGVENVRRIAVTPSGSILLGSLHGLFRSSSIDGPWIRVDTITNVTAIHAVDDETVVVATADSKVYRTTNNFTSLDTMITIAPYHGNILIGRGDTVVMAFRNRIARSSDKGRTWRIAEVATGGSEITGIAITRDGRTATAVDDGAGGPGMSLDTSLIMLTSQLGNPYVTGVAASDTAVRWVCSDGAYIARPLRSLRSRDSIDALTRYLVQRGSFDVWVDVRDVRRDTILAHSAYGPTALRRSDDSGRTWKQLHYVSSVRTIPPNGIDTIVNITSILRRDNGTALVAFDSVLYRSSQELSRTSFISELGVDDTFRKIATVAATVHELLAANDTLIAAVGRKTFTVSTDGGITWRSKNAPPSDTIYTATVVGTTWVLGGTSLYTSNNNGTSWQKIGVSPDKYGQVTVHDRDLCFLRTIRVSFSNVGLQILRSTDTARTWSPVYADSGGRVYYGTDIALNNGIGLVTASGRTVITTTDGGRTWTSDEIVGIRQEVDLRAAAITRDGWIRAAGGFSEIFERSLGTTSTVSEPQHNAIPQPTLRIFPDPSTGPFTVTCSVPMTSISIFTLDGRELFTMPCISNTAKINDRPLPNGPLIVRVVFDGGMVSAVAH